MEAESPAAPPITVSEPQSVTSTTKKMMDTLDLVASEVRQTKDSLMLSTTQAIKRCYLVSFFISVTSLFGGVNRHDICQ